MVKLVLSCDGGGVRGLATSQFLYRLEEDLGKPLYDVFDMFVGTSVGSIIAAAIGCRQASAAESLAMYESKTIKSIFDFSSVDKLVGVYQNDPKFNGKGKRNFLKNFFGELVLQNAEKPVCVTSYDLQQRKCVVLKSMSPDEFGTNVMVYDACDASSAAPAYFPSVKVNSQWLIDGGVVVNNPTMVAYAEAKALWRNEQILIISVGTGGQIRPIDGNKASGWGGIQWIANGLLDIAMDETVVEHQAELILGPDHVRVNSDLLQASDDLDDISSANIEALKNLGDYWYEKFGPTARALISRASTPAVGNAPTHLYSF